ncbi:glycoside hydrolase family 2 protein, partial [Bacteroides salyersiae]
MKKVISLLGMILLCCGISYATKVSITDNWKFTPSDSENFASSGLDDSKWRTVSIPHTWNDKDIIDEQRGYRRAASWYRKHLNIPLEMKGRKIVLLFEGVGSKADVYLNGEHLKTHMGAYTAFTVDITGHCKFGEKNILAVRADNSSSLGEVLPPVSGDFSMLGGIYRRVFLQTYHPVHFDFEPYASTPVLVQTPVVSEESAQVKLSCRIKNDADKNSKLSLVFALLDKEGKVVSRKKMKVKVDVGQSLPVDLEMASVNNPHLWSPDSPYLYTLKATIVDDKEGTLLQEVDSPLGFRWFSVDKTGFYLNGEYLKLRGAARHQDYWG